MILVAREIEDQLTVQFLKCKLLGFSDEGEDQEPGDEVESCVETECTGLCHDSSHAGECQTENTS